MIPVAWAGLFFDEPDPLWQPDLVRFTARLTRQLTAEGHPRPAAAAAILVDRGRLRLDRHADAHPVGTSGAEVGTLEDGVGQPDEATERSSVRISISSTPR